MKLFTAEQIRAWDAYTIEHEPVSSLDLMERAAAACTAWIAQKFSSKYAFTIFCGSENNGGDGLVIARLLHQQNYAVQVYCLAAEKLSADNKTNLERLEKAGVKPATLSSKKDFPAIAPEAIIVDALFGTGLNKPLSGLAGDLVDWINTLPNTKIAVDVPSGLPADMVENYYDFQAVVKTDYTVTFQVPKLSFFYPETGQYVGELVVADISLLAEYEEKTPSNKYWVDEQAVKSIIKKRQRFSHKGTYGHALLIGGSYGKTGAMLMAAKACVKAGAGLTTAYIPKCGYVPIQTFVPEVMAETVQNEELLDHLPNDSSKYNAIGIGPGMGTQISTRDALDDFLATKPQNVVIDADALNCLSLNFKDRKKIQLPESAILTPHPKEFDRMFGDCKDSFERFGKQLESSKKHKVYIVLKGTHTCITTPSGEAWYNSTGNPGMATGGSGDVLTGILTGLLAQGYSQKESCLLGVYLHGLAGDVALDDESMESLMATDIIDNIGKAFKSV